MRFWAGIGCILLTASCGKPAASPANDFKEPFPSRERVVALANTPVAETAKAEKRAFAPSWRVDPTNVPDAPTALDAKVIAGAPGHPASRELRCAARELGRFFAEHDAKPDPRIEHFILGACGFPSTEAASNGSWFDVSAKVSDEEIVNHFHADHDPFEKGAEFGAALVRKGDRASIFLVQGRRSANVELSPIDAAGMVKVTASLAGAHQGSVYRMYVNQGAAGFATCTLDPVALPFVTGHCPVAKGDSFAWVQLAEQEKERLLAHPTATVLVRREDTPIEITASARAAAPVHDGAQLSREVLRGVNEQRALAQLPALELVADESATAEKLVGHYFEAERKRDGGKSDLVALSLLAGYEVPGIIREGGFFSAYVSGTDDASRWLDTALDMPMARVTLLERDVKKVAVGSRMHDGLMETVLTTYAMFESDNHKPDVVRIQDAIAAARQKRGLLPQKRAAASDNSVSAFAHVRTGEEDALSVLQRVLDIETNAWGYAFQGRAYQTTSIDEMPIPDEALADTFPVIGVQVTHVKPRGAAWGHYIVFIWTAKQAVQQTASL